MKINFKEALIRLFTKEIGLKLISIFISIGLWFVVVNATDPSNTQTYRNVHVTVINENVITDAGKVMEIEDESNVLASVVVKAPRSVIRELGSSPIFISVTADMKNLSSDEKLVPIVATSTKYSDKIESIRLSEEFLKVNIENRKTIQLPIRATTSGELESGYVLGNITQATNQVRISGPESVVSEIKSALVDVQVTGFKEKISTSADIVLYDEDGNEIKNNNIQLNVSTVKVDVDILATKKIPVTFSVSGTPSDGYELTGQVEADVEEIVIAGNSNALGRINSLDIPADALNVTGLTSSLHSVITLSNYLPDGIGFADGNFSGKVNVVVYIEGYEEEEYSVYLRNINVVGIPEGFSGTEWGLKEDYIEFTLVGLAQNLEKVQLSELNFSLDFSDYELMNNISGFKTKTVYELPLLMDLPEGVSIKEPVMIGVTLTK